MELQGKIKLIGETQTFGSNGFRKREVVITTDEQYPQDIMIEFTQDKTDLLNDYVIGQDVKISINIRGREWVNPQGEAKYFNSINGWRIENIDQSVSNDMSQMPPADAFEPSNEPTEGIGDLPF